jgi:hypothetical protein
MRIRYKCHNCCNGGCTLLEDETWVGQPMGCPRMMAPNWMEAGHEGDENTSPVPPTSHETTGEQ